MRIKELNDFCLVGGTALALRHGHRLSVDLDLFSSKKFENTALIQIIENNFPDFSYRNNENPIGVFGYIRNVKVDFVQHYMHPLIADISFVDNVRIYSDKDIAAMKINAILRRAVKKDFWDLSELLKLYSVDDLIRFHTEKYPSQQLLISIPQAISYFDDAEESEDPVSLKGQTWESVKRHIKKCVSVYLL